MAVKVTIRDREVLMSIQPREVAAYLRAKGWSKIDQIADKASIWAYQDSEILLPLDHSLGDFAIRMAELLRALEKTENRSQMDILRDIYNSSGDVFQIRLDRADIEGGTVPLELGVTLFKSARDMLIAAACATIEPRAHYHARRPKEVNDYIRKVRLGQTEQGSYVISVISKVPPVIQETLPLGKKLQEEPFQRQVMLTLISGLESLKQTADHSLAIRRLENEAINEMIKEGVSSNLCDAISGIGSDLDIPFKIDFNFFWAVSRPISHTHRLISIPGDMMPIIEEIGRELREKMPETDVEIEGWVTKLEKDERESDSGTITLSTFLEGKKKNVRIELSGEAYKSAIKAHDQGWLVRCQGDLIKEGKRYILDLPRYFTVIGED